MLDLKTIAHQQHTHDIELRGHTVSVRTVPGSVMRRIESQLPYPTVVGDDPEAVARHKDKPAYQESKRQTEYRRQCLRAAYAADLRFGDLAWSEQMSGSDAAKLADEVSKSMTDLEVGQIYEASYKALEKKHEPANAIGTETKQGN